MAVGKEPAPSLPLRPQHGGLQATVEQRRIELPGTDPIPRPAPSKVAVSPLSAMPSTERITWKAGPWNKTSPS